MHPLWVQIFIAVLHFSLKIGQLIGLPSLLLGLTFPVWKILDLQPQFFLTSSSWEVGCVPSSVGSPFQLVLHGLSSGDRWPFRPGQFFNPS